MQDWNLILALCLLCAVLLGLAVWALYQNKKSKAALSRIIYCDPVTGGGTQAWFEQEAMGLLGSRPDGACALVYFDVDRFKVINDSFGRKAGDRTLGHVYRTYSSFLGEGEIIARLYGDRFGMLIRADSQQALLERLTDAAIVLNDFNFEQEQKYFLIIAYGVFVVSNNRMEFFSMLDKAQTACRKAKAGSGTGLVRCEFFCEADRVSMVREKEFENQLERALVNREFIIYLQPKCELTQGRIVGAEALVRWQHPQEGLIPPSDFIPLFERDGFIVPLDLYVFTQVCRVLRSWLDQGLEPVPISFNLSRAHLNDPGFFGRFEEVRKEYGVPPALLEAELTETMVFDNMELLVQIIAQLHSLGYKCSLDDFGSGYSSLNILKEIPVDVIKLDKAFFDESSPEDSRSNLVVKSVIELAKQLKIRTVSEGVEEMSQVEFLRGAHCDMIQGYVFSKPLPLGDFEQRFFGRVVPESVPGVARDDPSVVK